MRLLLVFLFLAWCSTSFSQEMSEWEVVYRGETNINKIDFYDDQYAVAVGDNGLVLLTTDGGTNWTDYSQEGVGDFIALDVISKDLILACTVHSVYKATDISKPWQQTFFDSDVKIQGIMYTVTSNDQGVFLCCDQGRIYGSYSNGDKWYSLQLNNLVKPSDDVLYCIHGKYDSEDDTVALLTTKELGTIYTDDNFGSLKSQYDYFDDVDVKSVNNHFNFSVPHFAGDNVIVGENNEIWLEYDVRPWMDAGDQGVSAAIALKHLSGDLWYAYAVGEAGYIAEAVGSTFGSFKEVLTPTDKDLNWIDWGADPERGGYLTATIGVVGDGVILRKRFGWGPVSVPRVSYHLVTDLYPNPFDNYFTVESKGWDQNEKVTARLYNINGVLIKEVFSGVLPEGSLQLQVVEALPQGVYLLELSSQSKKEVQRLVRN